MTHLRISAALACLVALAACDVDNSNDKTVDGQLIGRSSLQELVPGIWVDPRGCDHWLIDDGVEGYLSARLDRHGKPVCSGAAPPEYVTGPFRAGADINDPL
ncbi:hypothetical protein SAMN05444004_10249 [Jannaschia faecimaris]|uniref:Lipoprotein n=1 Tax=Jannaschia faecimaris TaxID=1244108 RepID=A0A1H3L161_9RHOB|nr:hypothetical protein [Jannaschia faecimaris]SDY58006.1 hypothetical protein SAMN05444004_10249 [Jannaschia faecimaris]